VKVRAMKLLPILLCAVICSLGFVGCAAPKKKECPPTGSCCAEKGAKSGSCDPHKKHKY
jgi:hypothetical protein